MVNKIGNNFNNCSLNINHLKTQGGKTMFGKRKKTLLMKVFVVFVVLAFTTGGFAARIIPTGKVSIIKDGKVIGEFNQETPLPEGSILRCEAKCAVKLDDVYMVAEPDTVFSITSTANRHEVLVQQGTVFYALNKNSRPLQFDTPAGNATTGDLSITDGELRGYVRVIGNKTEIGVIGGGSMMIDTGSGEMMIASGKNVTMTLAVPGIAAAGEGGQEGMSTNTKYALGAVGVGLATIAIFALDRGSGNGNGGSPAAP
jgi:hypothetical protein